MPDIPQTGWQPDDPTQDDRDRPIAFGAVPREVTHNRDVFEPPLRNQNGVTQPGLPYCTNYAGCSAIEIVEQAQTDRFVALSTAFSSWATRMLRGQQGQMVGATIRDFADAATLTGMASELAHPSGVGDSLVQYAKVKPRRESFAEAQDHQILRSRVIPDGDVEAIHSALQDGYAVHFGVYLGNSFFSTGSSGIVPPWDGARVNAHSMLLRDADLVGGKWGAHCLNSWGASFGKAGYCFLDDAWLSRLMDVRVYESVEVLT